MKNIKVNLLNSTIYGRLYYKNNPDIEPFVIFLQNNQKIKRTFSINIDSAIILDINENEVIQAAEFIIHRKTWKIDPNFSVPQSPPIIKADIKVVNLKEINELIETPVRSITDENYRYVFFSWGKEVIDKKWVYLSEQCYAAISGNTLIGFLIYLQTTNQ
jgi:hypothetical protein